MIHTVGPIYSGGNRNEENILISCYKNSLALAKEYNASSVAFPVISAGAYGYPKEEALRVAVDTIISEEGDMDVYIVLFDKELVDIAKKRFYEYMDN